MNEKNKTKTEKLFWLSGNNFVFFGVLPSVALTCQTNKRLTNKQLIFSLIISKLHTTLDRQKVCKDFRLYCYSNCCLNVYIYFIGKHFFFLPNNFKAVKIIWTQKGEQTPNKNENPNWPTHGHLQTSGKFNQTIQCKCSTKRCKV